MQTSTITQICPKCHEDFTGDETCSFCQYLDDLHERTKSPTVRKAEEKRARRNEKRLRNSQ